MRQPKRVGVNERRLREMRRLERHQQLRRWGALLFRSSKIGVLLLLVLATVGTVAWGSLSFWHKMGGGVLRGMECHGEVQCLGEQLMAQLGLERGEALERIELASVERGLTEHFSGDVEVKRDLIEGLIIVEAKPRTILGRFKKGDEWWILRSGGGVEAQARMGIELPLIEVEGPVDWEKIALFLEQLRERGTLWKELSLLRVVEGGRLGEAWMLSGRHRLLLTLDQQGVEGIDRYRRLLRHRTEIRSAKTVDMRFKGFAYVSEK